MKPGKEDVPRIRSAARIRAQQRRRAQNRRLLIFALFLLTAVIAGLAYSSGYASPSRILGMTTASASVITDWVTQVAGEAAGGSAAGGNFRPIAATVETFPTATPTHSPTRPPASATPTSPPSPTSTPPPPEPSPTAAVQQGGLSPLPVVPPQPTPETPILYYTQAGDTLKALAARFNVEPTEITSRETIPPKALFDPGVLLLIPRRLDETTPSTPLIPDSEVVYSPSALDFNIKEYLQAREGYLSTYREWRSDGWYDGAGVIQRVAIENSVNPRMLLAILEFQSHWVAGQPENMAQTEYPIGWLRIENEKKGLYYQLSWAVHQLNIGYYGWREGTVTSLTFPDGSEMRLAPDLNAGTVSVMYLFSRLYNPQEWAGAMYSPDGFLDQYTVMFGNPWLRAQAVEPLFPATLTQPPLELPFLPGHTWSYTGGPHSAWGQGAAHPRAALDFAPSAVEHGCYKAEEWATASAAGLVVRSEHGLIVLDLDGDGYEQTGWAILYLHLAGEGRVKAGTWVSLNDKLGHPSCEGGISTGTHLHMARKYNGEWILADGPMPFNLSGWSAHADKELYKGTLTKDEQVIFSSLVGSYESRITRPKSP